MTPATMSFRLSIPAAAACLLASCYPYPEKPIPELGDRPTPSRQQSVTDPEQQRIQQQRERAQREQAQREQTQREQTERQQATTRPQRDSPPPPPPTAPTRRPDFPYASPVHGKPGFVLSPYNNIMVDVRDIASGVLVQDPTYPDDETKRFRVP